MRQKLALTVGINAYGHGSDLAGCINDSDDVADTLRARGYQVTQQLDASATHAAITARLRDMIAAAKYGDRVVFHYSGHGTWVPDQDGDEVDHRDEAICPVDLWTQGPLLDDELHAIFAARRRGVRVHTLFDSCYSGTMSRALPDLERGPQLRARFLPPGKWARSERELARIATAEDSGEQRTLVTSAWVTWTAAQSFETACDAEVDGRPCGAGTYTLLRALAAYPGASWQAIQEECRRRLPTQDWPQTPTLDAGRLQRRWEALA